MDIYASLIIIIIIYILIFFFDRFFKTCSHYPYIQFLKGTGLEIKFLRIKWQTTALNRTFLRWSSGHSSFFNHWFKIGTYVTLLLLPVAVILLLYTMFLTFLKTNKGDSSNIIETIIPGVNLPASELGYYSLTLIISSVIHEMGHAIAAVRDDVHLCNVGVNLLFILPVAYVSLNTEDMQKLNTFKTLKIFCAGVWHNIVLSFVAYAIYLALPILFSSFFVINKGVIVTNIDRNSPLKGNNGLFSGDKIVAINDCKLTDYNTYFACIEGARIYKPGFCVSADVINKLDETTYVNHINNDEVNCCSSDKISSACFEYIEHNDGIVEIPQHSCLPIRPVIEKSMKFCNVDVPCPLNLHCIKPLLNNYTNILKLNCIHKDIIYMGHPYDLLQTVQVSQYIPKSKLISSQVPDIIEKMLRYIIIFSLGFAIVNVIPCLAMDGQHILTAVLNVALITKVNSKMLATISLAISLCGMLLLTCLTIHTIWVNLPFYT